MEGSGRPAPARNAGNAGRGGPARAAACDDVDPSPLRRASVCALPKNHRRDEKMAMRATQQPQRGGTTSCASRPSADIDRAKYLISLNATGEQATILSTVGRGGARRPRPGGEVVIEMLFRARGPLRAT